MSFLQSYFGFSRQQRRGLLVLCCICAALLAVRLCYPHFLSEGNITVASLPLIERVSDSMNAADGSDQKEISKQKLFFFDPNIATHEELLSLGFSEKTCATLLKFRKKFVFKKKDDLKKVYGLSPSLYAQLEPFIRLNGSGIPAVAISTVSTETFQPKTTIELNSADSITLVGLNGIGPVFAKRILKYRALLGGFASKDQLKEVYGLTEEVYEKIQENLKTDISLIKKIDLNKDDFKTINRHPYLSYELTKTIFDWRKKGAVTSQNIAAVIGDEEILRKISPYLLLD